MKIVLISILVSFFSCTSNDSGGTKSKYVQMNELWSVKANIDDVKKVFGKDYKIVESGITYNYPNSRYPQMAFFFDKGSRLREQFAFLQEAELQEFKKQMKCKWIETEEVKNIAHYQRIIKKGTCTDLSIIYETYLDLHGYEVRWKR